MTRLRIPLAEPCMDEAEAQAVLACVQSGWISTLSPQVSQFEQAFADWLGMPGAVAVNSGTSALHLALQLAGVGPGDKVAVPALTFVATVNPVKYLGATPVMVDVCEQTYALRPDALKATLMRHPDIKVIMVTHLYGHMADMQAIRQLAGKRIIIEDASEALGSQYLSSQYLNSQYPGSQQNAAWAGTLGDIGCFSFNGNKTITTGSGGMLVSRQTTLLERAHHLSMQAKVIDSPDFDHTDVGYNYRMNGMQAALGLAQLDKLADFLQTKRRIANAYYQGLQGTPLRVSHLKGGDGSIPWLSTVLCASQTQREALQQTLADHGIASRPFFKPLPSLQPYAEAKGVYPVAHHLWECGLCLPSSVTLTDADQQRVIGLITHYLATATANEPRRAFVP